jgi:hypothetical protein
LLRRRSPPGGRLAAEQDIAVPQATSSSKARKAGSAGKPPGEIIRAIAGLSDGTISLRRKIILSRSAASSRPMTTARPAGLELVVVYEGFPRYRGMAGHAMEALAQGIRESADETMVRHVVSRAAFLGDGRRRGLGIGEDVGDRKGEALSRPRDDAGTELVAARFGTGNDDDLVRAERAQRVLRGLQSIAVADLATSFQPARAQHVNGVLQPLLGDLSRIVDVGEPASKRGERHRADDAYLLAVARRRVADLLDEPPVHERLVGQRFVLVEPNL